MKVKRNKNAQKHYGNENRVRKGAELSCKHQNIKNGPKTSINFFT